MKKTKKSRKIPDKIVYLHPKTVMALEAFAFAADNLSHYLGLLQQKSILEISALERAMKQMDETDKVLAKMTAPVADRPPIKNQGVVDVFG